MSVDRDQLLSCLRIRRWADELVEQKFDTLEALLEASERAAADLSEAEVDEALGAHPRIGESHEGDGAEARFSAAEQSASQSPDEVLADRLEAGNRAYEERFGRVFLIRAAGRTREEILAELERRLANDPLTELNETSEQLRQIAALRLKATWENA
ncbi:2-oxo-4-hydroxy-4-carboxy-5-ureidoimidazoline decarboxylase [Demequina sp. NBRC 110055]|uniref:2-oxo-4-hydroxy-4-carboxy-5-ureidoimidazoline decarboxylase n=1 Tax=Demequina sp. NBRC 110055 TaxID=1570344 RepID=UPI0009FF6E48|nr:2-oxo-4-hydroxy-4-carboxy-5-ureidoimidazoline decarboxylase [Demequina sp. NBRC 110055]